MTPSMNSELTYSPCASLNRLFFLSMMRILPCLSISPMSPVWNQPSSSTASRVCSASLKYPSKTFGPRTQISPRGVESARSGGEG